MYCRDFGRTRLSEGIFADQELEIGRLWYVEGLSCSSGLDVELESASAAGF